MGFPRMNKKGFEFKSGMFAIVAIALLVTAFATIISQQSDKYNSGATSELDNYNKLSEISGTAESYEGSLTPEDPEPGQDPESNTFRGVYGIITGIFSAFNVVTGEGGMIDSVITQFGIPSYVRQGVVTLIFVAITFSLVAVIFRLSRGSA